jgi:hypothetical protein
LADQFLQVGIYTGSVLKSENPVETPGDAGDQVRVRHQPADGKGGGIDIHSTLLACAEEVIE